MPPARATYGFVWIMHDRNCQSAKNSPVSVEAQRMVMHRCRHNWLAAFALTVLLLFIAAPSSGEEIPGLRLTDTISPFSKAAFGVSVSPDGRRYVVAGREGEIHVFDVTTNRQVHTSDIERMVLALGYTPSGSVGISLTADGTMHIHDPESWAVQDSITLPFRCGFLAFNRSGSQVAVGGAGPQVLLYDLGTRKQIAALGNALKTQGILFSSDGIIANSTLDSFAGTRSEIRIFNPSGKLIRSFPSDTKELHRLVLSRDSARFGSISTAGRIEIYDRADGRLLRKWNRSDRLSQMAIFLPDSKRLLVGTSKGFDIYDPLKDEPIRSINIPEATAAYDATWIPGTNDFVIVHSRPNHQVTRWSVENLREPATSEIAGHPSNLAAPGTTATERKVVNGSADIDKATAMQGSTDPLDTIEKSTEPRTWTSNSGHTLNASWVGNDAQSVLLHGEDGQERVVDRSLLRDADNQFLNRIDQQRLKPDSFDQVDRSQELRKFRVDYIASAASSQRGHGKDSATPVPTAKQRAGRIHDLAVDSFGRVWLATDIGLMTLNGNDQMELIENGISVDTDEANRKGFARIAVDRFDRILLIPGNASGNYETGPIVTYDGKRWKGLPSIENKRFSDVARYGSKIVAVGDFNGIARLTDREWKVNAQTIFDEDRSFTGLETHRSGLTVVHSTRRESLLWNGKKFLDLRPQIKHAFEFPTWRAAGQMLFMRRDISAMWELCELNVSRDAIRTVYASEKDRSRHLYSFALASDNAIWISTAEGLFRLHGDQRQRLLDPVNRLLALPDGRMMTTFEHGRFKFRMLTPIDSKN